MTDTNTNLIGNIYSTSETELVDDNNSHIFDLIPCNQGDDVLVDPDIHPVLFDKLDLEGDEQWANVTGLWQFNDYKGMIDAKRHQWYFEGVDTARTYNTDGNLNTNEQAIKVHPVYGNYIEIKANCSAGRYFQINCGGNLYGIYTHNYTYEFRMLIRKNTGKLPIFNSGGTLLVLKLELLSDRTLHLMYDGNSISTSTKQVAFGTITTFAMQWNVNTKIIDAYVNGSIFISAEIDILTSKVNVDTNFHKYYGCADIDMDIFGLRFTKALRYSGEFIEDNEPWGIIQKFPTQVPNIPDLATSKNNFKIIADKPNLKIGDVYASVKDGNDEFDFILADGSEVDESKHPQLWDFYGGGTPTLPDHTPLNPDYPKRVVADKQQNPQS